MSNNVENFPSKTSIKDIITDELTEVVDDDVSTSIKIQAKHNSQAIGSVHGDNIINHNYSPPSSSTTISVSQSQEIKQLVDIVIKEQTELDADFSPSKLWTELNNYCDAPFLGKQLASGRYKRIPASNFYKALYFLQLKKNEYLFSENESIIALCEELSAKQDKNRKIIASHDTFVSLLNKEIAETNVTVKELKSTIAAQCDDIEQLTENNLQKHESLISLYDQIEKFHASIKSQCENALVAPKNTKDVSTDLAKLLF